MYNQGQHAIVSAGGAVYGSVSSKLSGNSTKTVLKDTVTGAVSGAVIGMATAGIGYGVSAIRNGGAATGTACEVGSTTSQTFSSKGYNPKPGERTLEGYVRNNANPEISLTTKSAGFNNNNGNVGGVFKRLGAESHGGVTPHVHQPQRNVAPNGNIYGSVGTKTSNGGVTLPTAKDVKQLYEYLNNGKYQ